MTNIDPRKTRERLLPQAGWQPWRKPPLSLEIDEWVSKQHVKRGDLPAHFEQDGCPYWCARSGLVTAVTMADHQAKLWTEKDQQIVFPEKLVSVAATKPEYVEGTLARYIAEAAAVVEAIEVLQQRITRFGHTHLGVDGNLFRYDHYKGSAGTLGKSDIDASEVLIALQSLVPKLQAAIEGAAIARQPWINNQGDIWKQTFVAHLGLLWMDLKGRNPPTSSKPFQDFIGAAWASLDTSDDESFERAIKVVTRGFRTTRGRT
jgi:hypothetical protein